MNPEAIEAAARAMAILDDHDGCFLEVDQWEGQEDWEKQAHPDNYPGMAYEDCEYWRGKASAALEAAAPYLIREARAAELEGAADAFTGDFITGDYNSTPQQVGDFLRDRAAAIRAGEA